MATASVPSANHHMTGPKNIEPELPLPMGEIDLEAKAVEMGIKYFLVSYVPLNADTRVSVIPRRVIKQVQQHGCGIPAAMFFSATGADPEMYLVPDPSTLIQLPWKPEYGWLSSDLYMHGRPFKQCPRRVLKRQISRASAKGLVMKAGVEPEFMILNKDGTDFGDSRDARQPMCLQEPLATMRLSPVIMQIYDIMEKLGWEPYEVDHEATSCQYEINFGYTEALVMADRYAFMKFMVKEIAELEGYTATFMPRPLPNLLCANGLHINVSLWNHDDENVFPGESEKSLGLSKTAYHFIGGMMKHAQSTCAIMCPTINSYKRLNSGSWCPNRVSWGGNNRTVLLRVPANNRVEHRLADGSTNLYLSLATILATGLDGIDNNTDPGEKCDILVNEHLDEFAAMPENLLDALRQLSDSKYIRGALGDELIEGFIERKRDEWKKYMEHLTSWERDFYINC